MAKMFTELHNPPFQKKRIHHLVIHDDFIRFSAITVQQALIVTYKI